MSNAVDIANTIIAQMGGFGPIRAMVGASNFFAMPESQEGNNFVLGGVSFKFKGSRKMNYVAVKLMADDTYTVEFKQLGKLNVKDLSSQDLVYAEDLKPLFESTTGLLLSLF